MWWAYLEALAVFDEELDGLDRIRLLPLRRGTAPRTGHSKTGKAARDRRQKGWVRLLVTLPCVCSALTGKPSPYPQVCNVHDGLVERRLLGVGDDVGLGPILQEEGHYLGHAGLHGQVKRRLADQALRIHLHTLVPAYDFGGERSSGCEMQDGRAM